MKNGMTESAITNLNTNNEITISRDQFFDFIKNKKDTEGNISRSTQHYLNYFDQYQKTGKKRGWNWAGIFNSFWVFYRRMWCTGLALLISWVIVDIIFLTCIQNFAPNDLENPLSYLADFVIVIPLMMYGDHLYLLSANKQISKGILKRGVSKAALFLPLLVLITYAFVAEMIFTKTNNSTISLFEKTPVLKN